jgi:hypothetical protein
MKQSVFPIFAIVAVSCLAAGGARAFTYDGRASLNSDASLRYQDPEAKLQNSLTPQSGANGTSGKIGNFTFQFSGSSPQSTGQSPFVPSGNSAFASPFGPNNLDLALGNRH